MGHTNCVRCKPLCETHCFAYLTLPTISKSQLSPLYHCPLFYPTPQYRSLNPYSPISFITFYGLHSTLSPSPTCPLSLIIPSAPPTPIASWAINPISTYSQPTMTTPFFPLSTFPSPNSLPGRHDENFYHASPFPFPCFRSLFHFFN